MSIVQKEPQGFDRVKAFPIVRSGSDKAPVYRVYNTNGALLAAFSKEEKAILFRDTVPVDRALLQKKT